MLLNQHSMLFGAAEDRDTRPNRVGVIDTSCKLKTLVMEAYTNASFLCEEYYCYAPEITINATNAVDPEEPIEICYPPQHLYHILFELFKNSMRAVIESRKKNLFDLPSLEVLLVKGENDVTIRLSDQGGGIPRHITDNLFLYLYSTAPRPSMTPEKAPLAGYGYGLPLSRLYARYFHGDLILNSYDGYGTDAVLYLKSHTHESVELLPVFNKTSTKQYKSAIPAADWTDPLSAMNRHYHPRHQTKALVT
jgi:pyruvate dehydrogenase kinase 2/3/4